MSESELVEQMLKTIRSQEQLIHELQAEILVLTDENESMYELLHGQ